MPRKQKKYHYIYKTTNIITNKYYIGMHSTNNLDDGYVGSGKRLWYSINKYGKENHKCEILEFLSDRKLLKEKEADMVNEELLQDPMCMNLTHGGNGGFDTINKQRKNLYGLNGTTGHGLENLIWGKKLKQRLIEKGTYDAYIKKQIEKIRKNKWSFKGKKHAEETKRKIGKANSIKQNGEKNSQYGTCWIYSLKEKKSIKIKKDDLMKYIKNGWFKGRRLKFD